MQECRKLNIKQREVVFFLWTFSNSVWISHQANTFNYLSSFLVQSCLQAVIIVIRLMNMMQSFLVAWEPGASEQA